MNNPSNKTQGVNAYNQVSAQTSVVDASPHRLIQLLIDAALSKIAAAKGHIANGDIAEKGKQLGLAVSIIGSLRGSLDIEQGGEIAENLDRLYEYMGVQLTLANVSNDISILNEVTSLILPLKAAWNAIPEDARNSHQQQQMDTSEQEQSTAR